MLRVRGLRFAHRDGAGGPVIDGLDFELRAGERVGIVGESGCGKTTLLRLLRRFHHEYEGSIEVLGRELGSYSHAELSRCIGYFSQDPRIVRGTVAENIAFGLPGVGPRELEEAARRAHIHEDILQMPRGYETAIGERGETLSGGQRQRICLARTLVRRPRILLLDEPTSQLDSLSQHAVQGAIDELEDVSVLMIAHRLSTLRGADRIVVMEGGRIAEQGSFAELARSDGAFADMLARDLHPAPLAA